MPSTCCCVPLCSNRGGHRFPKDLSLRKKWLNNIRRNKWHPTDTSVVCFNHFKPEDYITSTWRGGNTPLKKTLQKSAIPSIFAWTETLEISELVHKRQERYTRRQLLVGQAQIIEPVIIKEINDEAEITAGANNDFDTEREEVHKRKPEVNLEFSVPKRPCVQTKDQEDANDLDPAEKKKRRYDCRIFGEHVANKLSTYDSQIQAIVQHQINNILFEADMGRYSHSVPEQWSASPASSPSPQEVEAVLASSPAPHSRQETSSDLQLVLPHSSSSQPYLEVVKEEEGVTEQHLPHSESLEEEMIPELGSPHRSTSHHLDTNTELHRTDNSIYNESYNKAVESHIRTICDVVGKLTGNRPSLHKEDEFDIFGRSVAIQLRTLPFAIALETQLKLQSILTEMKLKTNYCQSESLRNGIPTIVAPT